MSIRVRISFKNHVNEPYGQVFFKFKLNVGKNWWFNIFYFWMAFSRWRSTILSRCRYMMKPARKWNCRDNKKTEIAAEWDIQWFKFCTRMWNKLWLWNVRLYCGMWRKCWMCQFLLPWSGCLHRLVSVSRRKWLWSLTASKCNLWDCFRRICPEKIKI